MIEDIPLSLSEFYCLAVSDHFRDNNLVMKDTFGRPTRDIRISVTDRCNYRCTYCMPYEEYEWLKREEVLCFEEIVRLAGIFVGLGVEKIRLTGGEPLLRKDLHRLVRLLRGLDGLKDMSVTTNGDLLARQIGDLSRAGLKRINVSLDTLNAAKFRQITKRGELAPVLDGLSEAKKCRLDSIKINTVVVRGVNDDEILDLVEFGRSHGFVTRFIEYMDVGNANQWNLNQLVSKKEILDIIRKKYPLREVGRANGRAPAVDYEFLDGRGSIGIIGSVTEPFCGTCDRARLTPDGKLVTCLFSQEGHDLKTPLRQGASDEELAAKIRGVWSGRKDRYSEERWTAIQTAAGYDPTTRQKIEMIRLGG